MLELNQSQLDIVTVDFHGLRVPVASSFVTDKYFMVMDLDGVIKIHQEKPDAVFDYWWSMDWSSEFFVVGAYKGDTTGWDKSAIQLNEYLIVTTTGWGELI